MATIIEIVISLAVLAGFGVLGMLWTGVALAETSRQVFGSVLTADLARAAFFGGMLAVCMARVAWQKGSMIWRGAALALAASCGVGVIGGLGLAWNRTLLWSELTDWLQPLAILCYALVLGWIVFRRYSTRQQERRLPWRTMLLAVGLGLLAAAWWPAAGALGTLSELLLAGIEALGISLMGAICLTLVFWYEDTLPVQHPIRMGLLAGLVCWAALTPVFAIRGWSAQGLLVVMPGLFFSLTAASLVVSSRLFQTKGAGWIAWAFLFPALLLPLAFTNGQEGDWLPGGLPSATNTAFLISVVTCLVMTTGIFLFGKKVHAWKLSSIWQSWLPVGGMALGLVLVGGVYAAFGHVGLQPDTFFVVMVDQPSTSFANEVKDPAARREAVYQELVKQAQKSQSSLRAYLDAQGVRYTPYYLVNGLEMEGNPILRNVLAQRSDVARILNSPHLRPQPPLTGKIVLAEERPKPAQLPWGIQSIGSERVWSALRDKSGRSIDGQGIVIGAIGTGVDWTHPDLQASYLGAAGRHDYTWYDPWEGTPAPVDTNGIGTHTLGTVVGSNGIGVAPGARWIACRSLARDLGNPPLYLSCMQFLLAPFPQHGSAFQDGDPSRGANIIDAAWICPAWEGCDDVTLSIAVQHLADAGQMFVTGTGNDGPACSSIVSPGLSGDALTVGALGKNGLIAPSSSRGPITADGSGRLKPDLIAPGVSILSDLPDGRYAEFNGTSMAAAHVAGVVALMWSANPALIGNIEQTKQLLAQTAHYQSAPNPCGSTTHLQNNDYGYGVVDAYQAVQQALNVK